MMAYFNHKIFWQWLRLWYQLNALYVDNYINQYWMHYMWITIVINIEIISWARGETTINFQEYKIIDNIMTHIKKYRLRYVVPHYIVSGTGRLRLWTRDDRYRFVIPIALPLRGINWPLYVLWVTLLDAVELTV